MTYFTFLNDSNQQSKTMTLNSFMVHWYMHMHWNSNPLLVSHYQNHSKVGRMHKITSSLFNTLTFQSTSLASKDPATIPV